MFLVNHHTMLGCSGTSIGSPRSIATTETNWYFIPVLQPQKDLQQPTVESTALSLSMVLITHNTAEVKYIKPRSQMKIGTWNVHTLHPKGKFHNVIQEMKRLELEIMGCSEVRWTQSGKIR